jgi:hypothetical protein
LYTSKATHVKNAEKIGQTRFLSLILVETLKIPNQQEKSNFSQAFLMWVALEL